MYHIKKHPPSFDDSLLDQYWQATSATLHEAQGRRGAIDCRIKSIARGMKLCGRALTVRCLPGDNIMLAKAISMARKGDVLVLDAGNAHHAGGFGEVLATECVYKGVAGLVTTGSVRDSEALIRMNFPVFAWGLSICGTSKAALGDINHPVSCGGVVVHPGDLILGDDDGVVAVPAAEAQAVLEKAIAREHDEALLIERIRSGESFSDIKNYDQVLAGLGCTYE